MTVSENLIGSGVKLPIRSSNAIRVSENLIGSDVKLPIRSSNAIKTQQIGDSRVHETKDSAISNTNQTIMIFLIDLYY